MINIKIVPKEIFQNNIIEDWKEIFIEEYKKYWKEWKLLWIFYNNNFIWWAWIWYNPDFMNTSEWNYIIERLNSELYNKISYFYIIDKEQRKWYWKIFIKNLLKSNNKFYLTCNWDALKRYYIKLWFKLKFSEWEKYILYNDNNIGK